MKTGGTNEPQAALVGIGLLLFLVYGLVQIYAGFIGIQHHCGAGWAIGALAAALFFRFSLPLTVGAFFGAMNVWGWHWVWSLVFAAPGLLFMLLMIPGSIATAFKK